MVDVFWRGHRVGVTNQLSRATYASARLDNNLSIKEVADLNLKFSKDFAELFGLTGVELE